MTSRIQEDGGGTEAKWADIDDDEDDWAPETIEWTDGTKVTLTHNEPAPPPDPSHEQAKETPPPEPTASAQDSVKIAAPKPTTSVGPNPTVLRLGANAERQAKAASISSKGTNDRMASGSTSPAPPPAKSPWATLPPVERVSPVNPTMHPPPAPVSTQMRPPAGYPPRDDDHHAPVPPKEIAADDFNRTWREAPSGAPRELYNSRSGRYEPVADTRRTSWRHDQGSRAPAVLQRSSHADPNAPAEPSAAFQTHRSSHHDGMGMGWGRRRASSNASGGSGGFGRRMSWSRAEAQPRYNERRGSHANGMVDPAFMRRDSYGGSGWASHTSAVSDSSPVEQQQQQQQQPPMPAAAEAPAPQAPQEDPVALQERVMKEKRLEARQRRLEQEEKEKAARDERIRQKLAALGPPPDKTKRKDNEGRKAQAPTSPTTIHSPPKPPVPEPTGEPKQYGMMKVHHPDAVKKLVAANEKDRTSEKPVEKTSPHLRRAPSPHREPKLDATSPSNLPQPSDPHHQDRKADEHGAQWRGNLNVSSSYSPWSTNPNLATTSPSVNNPWKPLSSDKTLGNGIFDQSLGGFPPRDLPIRTQLGLDQPTMSPPTFPPSDLPSVPPLPSPENRAGPYDPLSSGSHPGPIGPPSTQRTSVSAWHNFAAVAPQQEKKHNERYRQEYDAKRNGPTTAPSFEAVWKKIDVDNTHDTNRRFLTTTTGTWKQPQAGNQANEQPQVGNQAGERPVSKTTEPQGVWTQIEVTESGQRRVVKSVPVESKPKNGSPSNPLSNLDAPIDALPFADSAARPLVSVPARSSRFFPNATEQPKRPTAEKSDHPRSPSPPPPDEISSHPAYSNGSGRPLVHLPSPRPVVKLPPKPVAAAPAAPAAPPTFASMAAAPPRAAPAPTSTAISWQEKINTLFGKTTPPEKKSALAVASASKEPLDVQLPAAAVSVSLPTIEPGVQNGDGDLAVRQVEEAEAIFEDREPGSQPGVRVPNMAPPAAWGAAPPHRIRSKVFKPLQVHSIEPFLVGTDDKDASGNTQVVVRLPGATAEKSFVLPKKSTPPSPRNRGSPNFKPRRGHKAGGNHGSRKPSSHQQSRNASWGPRTQTGPR